MQRQIGNQLSIVENEIELGCVLAQGRNDRAERRKAGFPAARSALLEAEGRSEHLPLPGPHASVDHAPAVAADGVTDPASPFTHGLHLWLQAYTERMFVSSLFRRLCGAGETQRRRQAVVEIQNSLDLRL